MCTLSIIIQLVCLNTLFFISLYLNSRLKEEKIESKYWENNFEAAQITINDLNDKIKELDDDSASIPNNQPTPKWADKYKITEK